MNILDNFSRFFTRFRYPVTLPEDLARDLGLPLSNSLNFRQLVEELSHPTRKPKTLWRWMRRTAAEKVFQGALKKEIFCTSSLFSYYFAQGWLVFALYFDENSNLRRLYVQVPSTEIMDGFDIPLTEYFESHENVTVLQ